MPDAPYRLFVAIAPDPLLRAGLADWCQRMKKQLHFRKWVHPDDYHITLKFLGESNEETAEKVKEALQTVAAQHRPFSLFISGLGTFGKHRRPRILWAGIGGDGSRLRLLRQDVENALVRLDFPEEKSKFAPHLTLARHHVPDMAFEPDGLKDHRPPKEITFPWEVKNIVLYHSALGREPMYRPLAVFPFPS